MCGFMVDLSMGAWSLELNLKKVREEVRAGMRGVSEKGRHRGLWWPLVLPCSRQVSVQLLSPI